MAVTVAKPAKEAVRRRPIDIAWGSVVVLVPVMVSLLARLGTTDLAYHLRAGEGILVTHSLPRVDTYTFSTPGASWVDQQWGAQVVLAFLDRVGGWATLAASAAVLIGISFWFVYLACRARGADIRTSSLLTVGGYLVASPTLALRPQLLALPLFAAALWALASRQTSPHRLYAIPVLAAICANVHGSFTIFPLIVGLAWIEDARAHAPGSRRLFWLAIITAVATLLNPFGIGAWTYAYDLARNPTIRDTITEWAPVALNHVAGVLMLGSALAIVVVLARRGQRTPWPSLLWLGVFFILAMSASRAIVWWAMVAPVVVAELLPADAEREPEGNEPLIPAVALVAALSIAVIALLPWWRPNHELTDAPYGITQAVVDNTAPGSRLFANQAWGSWFEYVTPDRPVFVDSRIEIIPGSVWRDYGQVGFAGADWKSVLDKWKPDAIVAASDWELLPELEAPGSGWTSVYRDDDGEVFVPS